MPVLPKVPLRQSSVSGCPSHPTPGRGFLGPVSLGRPHVLLTLSMGEAGSLGAGLTFPAHGHSYTASLPVGETGRRVSQQHHSGCGVPVRTTQIKATGQRRQAGARRSPHTAPACFQGLRQNRQTAGRLLAKVTLASLSSALAQPCLSAPPKASPGLCPKEPKGSWGNFNLSIPISLTSDLSRGHASGSRGLCARAAPPSHLFLGYLAYAAVMGTHVCHMLCHLFPGLRTVGYLRPPEVPATLKLSSLRPADPTWKRSLGRWPLPEVLRGQTLIDLPDAPATTPISLCHRG